MNYPSFVDVVVKDGSTVRVERRSLKIETINQVIIESERAHLKHAPAGMSIFDPKMPRLEKIVALMEEVGEVARAMTRDDGQGKDHLIKELIQVANVALTWAESEEDTEDWIE